MDDEYYREQDHFAAIASVLLAGDVQARYVANAKTFAIEVRGSVADEVRILWSNAEVNGGKWGYSIIRENENVESAVTILSWDADSAEVAQYIATYEYPIE